VWLLIVDVGLTMMEAETACEMYMY